MPDEAVQDEVDQMINQLEAGVEEEGPPTQENDQPENGEVEDQQDESPDQTEETEGTEQPEAETVESDEQPEEDSSDKVSELEEKIEQLEQQLESEDGEAEESDKTEEESEEGSERLEVDFSDEDFTEIEDDLHAEVVSDPEKFGDFLRNFAENVSARTQEQVLQQVPQLVEQRVQQRVKQQVTLQRYWQNNPELQEHRKKMAKTANEVQSDKPNASLSELLEEAGKRVRKELDIEQTAEEVDQDAQENPAFTPDQQNGPPQNSQDGRSDEQKKIDQMFEQLG